MSFERGLNWTRGNARSAPAGPPVRVSRARKVIVHHNGTAEGLANAIAGANLPPQDADDKGKKPAPKPKRDPNDEVRKDKGPPDPFYQQNIPGLTDREARARLWDLDSGKRATVGTVRRRELDYTRLLIELASGTYKGEDLPPGYGVDGKGNSYAGARWMRGIESLDQRQQRIDGIKAILQRYGYDKAPLREQVRIRGKIRDALFPQDLIHTGDLPPPRP